MPKVKRMSLEQRRRKDRDRKREQRNQQREMQRLMDLRPSPMEIVDNAVVTDGDDKSGCKLFGSPVKKENMECHGFIEEMQKQTVECDMYVKEEKLDSDIYVKEGITDSYMDGKEDEIHSGRTLKICSKNKVDRFNSSSVFVTDGIV